MSLENENGNLKLFAKIAKIIQRNSARPTKSETLTTVIDGPVSEPLISLDTVSCTFQVNGMFKTTATMVKTQQTKARLLQIISVSLAVSYEGRGWEARAFKDQTEEVIGLDGEHT